MDYNALAECGTTPLHYAVENNHEGIMKEML